MGKVGLLYDFTECIGCMECVKACKKQNKLPDPSRTDYKDLNAETYTIVLEKAGSFFGKLCMHCKEAACVSACPVGALQKTPEGAVIYDASMCIGCRYCMIACPFQIPKYEWGNTTPAVRKCIYCYDIVKEGEQTACARACPTGARMFGERDRLLEIAKRRIAAKPDRYVDYIYGEKEAGGTSTLLLSGVPFDKLGFRMDLGEHSYPELTWVVMEKIPYVVVSGYLLLGGIWWVVDRRRRMEVGELEETATGGEEETEKKE
jgi:formate dehydrogenase iron-sulfur subunit